MERIGIEETLLEYHRVIDKNWQYTIERLEQLPKEATHVQSVCINRAYIQYYEQIDIQKGSSTLYWALEFVKQL